MSASAKCNIFLSRKLRAGVCQQALCFQVTGGGSRPDWAFFFIFPTPPSCPGWVGSKSTQTHTHLKTHTHSSDFIFLSSTACFTSFYVLFLTANAIYSPLTYRINIYNSSCTCACCRCVCVYMCVDAELVNFAEILQYVITCLEENAKRPGKKGRNFSINALKSPTCGKSLLRKLSRWLLDALSDRQSEMTSL